MGFDESAEKSPAGLEASRPHLESEAGARGEAERAQLLSRETSAAVDSAFNTLAQTVLVQNARTLEDLVREMLRPMLKTGSMTISRAWSSAWSAPRSSGFRADA